MTAPDRDSNALGETQMLLINRLCNQFEAEWQAGRRPALEELLQGLPAADKRAVLHDLLPLEIEYRQHSGESVNMDDYAKRFPEADRKWLGSLFYSTRVATSPSIVPANIPEQLGDYQILSRIGGGGMGAVYKALHVRMNRVVALKILRPDVQRDEHLIQRFEREVRAAARLTHPNIVAALDAREQDGLHYLITEYVDGLDLDEIVHREGPLPVAAAVDVVLQTARGLDYAHRQGVIHRDIKPANLLRNADGVVKVLDMGLARIEADTATQSTDLTNSGMMLGTAAYMAPEQARDVRRADARSDIYSLGCTLYYLLTGRPAFTGASPIDTLLSHMNEPIPTLTDAGDEASEALRFIFARMVAKQPEDRFQSAAELVEELETLLAILPMDLGPLTETRAEHAEYEFPTRAVRASTLHQDPTELEEAAEEPRSWRKWLMAVGALVAAIVVALSIPSLMAPPPANPEHPAQGKFSLGFNGTSSYVSAPTLHPMAGATYTIEAVVEPETTDIGNIVGWMGPDWMGIYLRNRTWGLARQFKYKSRLIEATQQAEMGKRVHLAGVYDELRLQLYIDGKLAVTGDSDYHMPDTTPGLFIGGSPPDRLPAAANQNKRYFAGRIHTVRISRGVRYRENFEPPKKYESDPETLALYHFDAGTGTVVKDLSSGHHDAEIHDAEWKQN